MLGWLYGLLLRSFPPDFRKEERPEACDDFERVWRHAPGRRRRLRWALVSFGRLPVAFARDWAGWMGDAQRRREYRIHEAPQRRNGMSDLVRSVRHAVRGLAKNPSFSLSTGFLMALGIGAVTTIFTIVDHVVLRPLPYPEPDRLVTLEQGSHSGPLVRELERLPSFQELSAVTSAYANLIGVGQPQRIVQGSITSGFFELFGATPAAGRLFDDADFASPDRVVVSRGAWSRIWGDEPGLVGRSISVDGESLVVVGVLGENFATPRSVTGPDVDLWRPLDWSDPGYQSHERWALEVAARLAPGRSASDAQVDVDELMARMATVHENYRTDGDQPRTIPVTPLSEATVRDVRSGLGLLMGAVTLLLLVACVNVAHLFMARGLGRGRELAVRRALGASTTSLVGHLAVESLLLGLMGGLGGVVLAFLGLQAFMGLNPDSLPRAAEIGLDPRVLAFAAALSVLTALVFGLLPALRTMGRDHDPAIRPSGRGGTANRSDRALRQVLIVAEVAVSLVLVASASLLLRTFIEVQRQDPGFDTANVWTIPLTPREVDSPASYRLQMEEVRQSVAGVAGVQSAAYGLTMPFELTGGGRCCWRSTVRSASSGDDSAPWLHPVSPEYFTTLGVEILHGTSWSAGDATSSPIPAVVNESFATELFGSPEAALGQVLIRAGQGSMEFLVTGVARDTRYFGLDAEPEPNLFIPVEVLPFPITRSHIAVRVAGNDAGLGGRLREAVWAAAPTLPVPTVRSMEGWMENGTAQRRFDSALFAAFGLLALLLAAGGLYGTLLYVASQRRRELAIRQALGASRAKIERWMLRGGLLVAAAGVLVGLLGSWGAARFLESRLWGVEPSDPVALLGAAGLLLGVAAVASWLPARWAGRTDPMEALQAE